MALTQVRAKIGEEWVTLTLNEATGRYEAEVTAPGTSVHQPGGYWPAEVEITNEDGNTATATADTMPTLRLVVRETAAPTLTLISPAPGYLQTNAPTFVFEAVDEEGGSGVDPESFVVATDSPGPAGLGMTGLSFRGSGATAAIREEISGGYRFTWTAEWADGAHTVTASVSDYDGNTATVSGAYTVDTVPPALYVQKPYQRHVVDAERVLIAGVVLDATSGINAVTVAGEAVETTPSVSGVAADSSLREGAIAPLQEGGGPQGRGEFSTVVPLAVGENTIPITVTDKAGNVTTAEVYMIRLVTDRDVSELDTIKALWSKPVQTWTEEDRETWDAAVQRCGWTAETLNRVGIAVDFLAGELKKRGYIVPVATKTDWTKEDAPTRSQMDAYLKNVDTVRTAQRLYTPEIPYTLRKAGTDEFNAVEKALVETDAIFPQYFAWTAGELSAGGF